MNPGRRALAVSLLVLWPLAALAGTPKQFVLHKLRIATLDVLDRPLTSLEPIPVPFAFAPGETRLYFLRPSQYAALVEHLPPAEATERRIVAPTGYETEVVSGRLGTGGAVDRNLGFRLDAVPVANGIRLTGFLQEGRSADRPILRDVVVPAGRILVVTTSAPVTRRQRLRRLVAIESTLLEPIGSSVPAAYDDIPATPAISYNALLYDVPPDFELSSLGAGISAIAPPSRNLQVRALGRLDDVGLVGISRRLAAITGVQSIGTSARLVRQTVWGFALTEIGHRPDGTPARRFRTEVRGEIVAGHVRSDLRLSEQTDGPFESLADLRALPSTAPLAIVLDGIGGRRLLILSAAIVDVARSSARAAAADPS